MTKVKQKIDPSAWFTLQDIVTKQMFSWCAPSFWSVRNVVALDRRKDNMLQAVIIGTGRATKYKFKGENIIKFINAVESGEIKLG